MVGLLVGLLIGWFVDLLVGLLVGLLVYALWLILMRKNLDAKMVLEDYCNLDDEKPTPTVAVLRGTKCDIMRGLSE